MQGYATLADEAVEQMREMGVTLDNTFCCKPVSVQWPVCVLGYLVDVYSPQNLGTALLLNLTKADCILFALASKAHRQRWR